MEDAISAYLASVPEPARSTLSKVRAIIRAAAPPEATEVISYGVPTFKFKGPLLGFAAFPNHCSLFAFSGTFFDAFKEDLTAYSTSKGTIQFRVDTPLPAALLKKLVKARVAINERPRPRVRSR